MCIPSKLILRNKTLNVTFIVPKQKVDCCIVDEGSLLHRTVWPLNSTYSDTASQHLKYLNDKYSSNASEIVVVFDGYIAYSTKMDKHTHINRSYHVT